MAKAKKQDRVSAPAGKPATAGNKQQAKKPAAPAAAPLIDTSLAAVAAAKMVASKAGLPSGEAAQARPESASFKHMKDSLSRPAGTGLDGVLGAPPDSKKSYLPFSGGKQVGRNQTFGADVNRAGVPRRTGG